MRCHGCGASIAISEKIFRGDSCPVCGRDLHCCKNCAFHDVSAHHECRESQAEWVRDKEQANFCDYFRPAEGTPGQPAGPSSSGTAKKRLEDLFKKKT